MEAEDKCADLEVRNEDLQAQLQVMADARKQADEAKAALMEARKAAAEQQWALDEAHSSLAAAERQAADAAQRASEVEMLQTALNDAKAGLEEERSALQQERKGAAELQKALDEARSALGESGRLVAGQAKEIKMLQTVLADARRQLEEQNLKAAVTEARRLADEHRVALEKAREPAAELQKALDEAHSAAKESERLAAALDALRTEMAATQTELAVTQQQAEETRRQFEEEKTRHTRQTWERNIQHTGCYGVLLENSLGYLMPGGVSAEPYRWNIIVRSVGTVSLQTPCDGKVVVVSRNGAFGHEHLHADPAICHPSTCWKMVEEKGGYWRFLNVGGEANGKYLVGTHVSEDPSILELWANWKIIGGKPCPQQ